MTNFIRELLHRKPFKPLRITLSNGESIDVVDQRQAAMGETHITVYRQQSDRRLTFLAEHIAAIESMSAK